MRALCVAVVMIAGCIASPEPAPPWHGRDLSATDPPWQAIELGPRMPLEFDYHRQEGQALSWDWFVEERMVVSFDVHAHIGMTHRYYADMYAEENASTVMIESTGPVSLLWHNPHSSAVTLWVRVPPDHASGP